MTDTPSNAATEHTRAVLASVADRLPPDDLTDAERAQRGLIARLADPAIVDVNGNPAWDTSNWEFIQGDAPPTVNPSLWRQAKLNGNHGLFKVTDGFYQVRGHDTSNVTLIEGETGWVVIDPLTFEETARASMALVTEHLGERPITAVIYTHSHIDHYGGIRGLLTDQQIAGREIPIVAPEGFVAAAVAENIVAEPVMGRRALYQYGMTLPWSPVGHVDQGLGKGVPIGTTAMVPPTIDITQTGQELTLDGVRIEFQLTPDTEAPAEMHFYFPDHRVLCLAENCTGTMHNVITLRGAVVRDSLRWSRSIQESMDRYGDRSDVAFASHSWPHWGTDTINDYMANQRDLYRWIHDQTMRLANLGATPTEIAEELELPPGLWSDYRCHGYYGTLSHNVKGVYQRYLGWYDGHPATLEPHPPVEAGRRYVELAGGIDALVEKATASYEQGDYRWVAEVLRHAVFAHPDHRAARDLQAAAFEQLAYQAEAGPWRDVYLTGAQELRTGTPDFPFPVRPRHVVGLELNQLFDYLAVRVDGARATELGSVRIDWHFPDTGEQARVTLSNGTLHGTADRPVADPDLTVTCSRAALDELIATGAPIGDLIDRGDVVIEGDDGPLRRLWDLMADFEMFFAVIEP
jgi:alkyl sulfatase BDS1-like metallo-beta-lactamase superfamily hydrolase